MSQTSRFPGLSVAHRALTPRATPFFELGTARSATAVSRKRYIDVEANDELSMASPSRLPTKLPLHELLQCQSSSHIEPMICITHIFSFRPRTHCHRLRCRSQVKPPTKPAERDLRLPSKFARCQKSGKGTASFLRAVSSDKSVSVELRDSAWPVRRGCLLSCH